MSGDAEHLWIHIVEGELLCRDRVHFVLQRETNTTPVTCYWLF